LKPSSFPCGLLLAAACELASAAPVPAAGASSAAASAACPAHVGASQAGRATSKVRHIPAEGDPCATSNGVAKPTPH
jgi:hypothetical protein